MADPKGLLLSNSVEENLAGLLIVAQRREFVCDEKLMNLAVICTHKLLDMNVGECDVVCMAMLAGMSGNMDGKDRGDGVESNDVRRVAGLSAEEREKFVPKVVVGREGDTGMSGNMDGKDRGDGVESNDVRRVAGLSAEEREKFVPKIVVALERIAGREGDADALEDGVTALVHCVAGARALDPLVAARVVTWCSRALLRGTHHEGIMQVAVAVLMKCELRDGAALSGLAISCAHLLAVNGGATKFDALTLVVECLQRGGSMLGNDVYVRMGRDAFTGLVDILVSRKIPRHYVWASVTLCVFFMSRLGLTWVLTPTPKGDFFGLLMGLVGVEIAMIFEPVVEEDAGAANTLAPCVQILELVMEQIDHEGVVLLPNQILAFRQKLGDIARVALHFVTEEVEAHWADQVKCAAAAALLSKWAALDSDALTSAELFALVPFVVQQAEWFLPCLQQWMIEPEFVQDFAAHKGLQRLAALLKDHLVLVAQERPSPVWHDMYRCDAFDSMVNLCSALATCDSVHLGHDGVASVIVGPCVDAANHLERATGDGATLLGFICAVLAHLLHLKGLPRGVEACHIISLYLLRALVEGGLSTVYHCANLMERGQDHYGLRSALQKNGTLQKLQRFIQITADSETLRAAKALSKAILH